MTTTNRTNWTVSKIRETMTDAGSHWWSKGAMKSFGTRALPTVYQGTGGIFFVTSEQPPHGERGFTVRQYDADKNAISTVGGPAGLASMTQADAIAEAKRCAAENITEIVEPLEGQDAKKITHLDRIDRMLRDCERSSDDWKKRHAHAWKRNYGKIADLGCGLVGMIYAAAQYADAHAARFESDIGEDSFIGPQWEQIVKGLRALLNGETAGLDCGLVDGLLVDMLRAEGFDE